jgi:signal transduction histidine kinase
MLHVRVADNGEGISSGNRDRVFEPFFTTRRESGGTGMGLQIVRSMLQAHGGTIELLPSTSGAAFELRIPLA